LTLRLYNKINWLIPFRRIKAGIFAFWGDVMRRRLIVNHRRFGKTYRPHFQGLKQSKIGMDCLDLEDGTVRFVPKRRQITTNLCVMESQKREDVI